MIVTSSRSSISLTSACCTKIVCTVFKEVCDEYICVGIRCFLTIGFGLKYRFEIRVRINVWYLLGYNRDEIVLAICGKAGSGKDAFASTLIEKGLCLLNSRLLERDTYTVPIHEHGVSYGWCFEDVVDTGVGASPRQLMQFIGTDLCNSDYKKNFHR
jgi:hypothetical protein